MYFFPLCGMFFLPPPRQQLSVESVSSCSLQAVDTPRAASWFYTISVITAFMGYLSCCIHGTNFYLICVFKLFFLSMFNLNVF